MIRKDFFLFLTVYLILSSLFSQAFQKDIFYLNENTGSYFDGNNYRELIIDSVNSRYIFKSELGKTIDVLELNYGTLKLNSKDFFIGEFDYEGLRLIQYVLKNKKRWKAIFFNRDTLLIKSGRNNEQLYVEVISKDNCSHNELKSDSSFVFVDIPKTVFNTNAILVSVTETIQNQFNYTFILGSYYLKLGPFKEKQDLTLYEIYNLREYKNIGIEIYSYDYYRRLDLWCILRKDGWF